MTAQELKSMILVGAREQDAADGLAVLMNSIADELEEVAENLRIAAESVDDDGNRNFVSSALMIAVARRVAEDVLREAGEAFDVAVFAAGIAQAEKDAEAETQADP